MKLEYLMEYLPTSSCRYGTPGQALSESAALLSSPAERSRDRDAKAHSGRAAAIGGSEGLMGYCDSTSATFETDDGALIYAQYYGVLRPEGDRPLAQPGQPSEYGDAYFMTTPRFETGDERYSWLNGLICVAEGKRTARGLSYRVYAVVNG
jgi:hypothetical protein